MHMQFESRQVLELPNSIICNSLTLKSLIINNNRMDKLWEISIIQYYTNSTKNEQTIATCSGTYIYYKNHVE